MTWPAVILRIAIAILLASACPCSSRAADNVFQVTKTVDDGSQGTLRWAINQANAAGAGTQTISIELTGNQTIALGSALPILDNAAGSIVVENPGQQMVTIDGQDASRVFFVASGTVSISNVAITNGAAQGGDGGAGWTGGGGGLGAGGAIFVNSGAHVTIENVQFDGNQATGGNGGAPDDSRAAGGGGGGFGGDGAASSTYGAGGGGGFAGSGGTSSSSGGGGGGGIAADGGEANAGGGGGGGTTAGYGANTVTGGNGNAGATGGAVGSGGGDGSAGESPALQGAGGGGAGGNSRSGASGNGGAGGNGGVGGGGGGGGRPGNTQNPPLQGNGGVGGNGGAYGGGGGGAYGRIGGNGGIGGDFGGGGGGGNSSTATNSTRGGNGGFGGGGGGTADSDDPNVAEGGFGAGNGGVRDLTNQGGGGGGSGYGGAIFVRDGGTLTVIGTTTANSAVQAGAGGDAGASAGSAAGQDLYLMSGVTATFDGAGNSFSGSIAGAGSVTVKGMGTTELSGANTYTGDTRIQDQSRLIVNGSITSNTTIDSDATLGGTGTIYGDVTNNGNVAPGNSIGRLIVDGAYTQNSGTTLTIEIDAGGTNPGVNNDLLLVDSAILNGGTVAVEAAAGTYSAGMTYHFLESMTPIVGAFDGITGNVGGFGLELGYDFDGFFYWSYFRLIASDPEYWQYAATQNELAVANYLDSIVDDPNSELQDMFDELDTLSGDPAAMQSAFNAMSDQVSPTTAQVGLQNTTLVVQQLAGQLRSGSFLTEPAYAKAGAAPVSQAKSPVMLVSYDKRSATPVVTFVEQAACDSWQGWSFGYGLGGNAKSDGNAAGLTYGMGGMLLGAERYFDQGGRIGFFGGYQGTGLRLDGLSQSARINGGMFGSYLHNDDGFNYYTAITGLQFNGYDTTRNIQFAGVNETASGNFSGWQGYGYLERGVSFRRVNATLQPYAALQYIYLRQNNYTETGAGVLNLDVAGIDANSLRSLVGGRLQYDRGFYGGRLLPEVRALWLHEFLSTDSAVNSFFAPIGGGSFAIQGLNLGRDWAIVGAGVRYDLSSGWQLYGNYDAQVNTQQVFHVGSGGLSYAW